MVFPFFSLSMALRVMCPFIIHECVPLLYVYVHVYALRQSLVSSVGVCISL